jgi:putative endonuclease
MEKGGWVYIVTNKHNTTIYVGVTSELIARVVQHKEKQFKNSFTARYNCNKLVWYEGFHSIEEAIAREKQIKGWSRSKKIELIDAMNYKWEDLFEQIDS